MKEIIIKLAKTAAILAAAFVLAAIAADIYVAVSGSRGILGNTADLPRAPAVLVLGAAVYRGGQMSDVFLDRAQTALEVYRAGKASKILVSGDHRAGNYDEVDTARKFFIRNGVPGQDLFVDYAGFDTFASIYRAKKIFGVESLIVSTQEFHLPRALFIARSLGIDAVGIKADRQEYDLGFYNVVRENAARAKAFWDVLTDARSEFSSQPFPITGDGRESWE